MAIFDLTEIIVSMWEEPDEEKVETYIQELLGRFKQSPEGTAFFQTQDYDEPDWSELFLDFQFNYIHMNMIAIDAQLIREFLYDFIPERVIVQTEEAPTIIDELKAFWEFVKREFKFDRADTCLRVLNQKNIVKRVEKEMSNPAKFGMTKSIMMPAIEAGLDITDEQAVQQYIMDYNQKMQAEFNKPPKPLSKKTQAKYQEIKTFIDKFCNEHLNKEYAEISQKMAGSLYELRPCPFDKGRSSSWAAGIVYAAGRVNFLSDPSHEPYMPATEFAEKSGVSQATLSAKGTEIFKLLDLMQLHPDWTVASMIERNPLTWILVVNGMPVDIRDMPRDAQVEAYQMGLIPYIPADKKD